MHLEHFFADGFRNLCEVRVSPHRRFNAFLGPNGEGKTNLLEAIHLVAALRPLRPVERARDLVRFDSERGRVHGQFFLDGPLDIEVRVEPGGRRALVAQKAVRDIAEVASRVGVVAFTPEDLSVVRGAPERRRKALDRFAFALRPGFAAIARTYEQALERRNKLLKSSRVDESLLSSYTEPLVNAGVELIRDRLNAATTWAPAFQAAAHSITDAKVSTTLSYACTVAPDLDFESFDEDHARQCFWDGLRRTAEGERARRTTLVGPHLDDLLLTLGDRRARHLASQGEARAIVLALKIAEVNIYTAVRGEGPLLLLDDVAGELDPHKAACLFRTVDEVGSQVFVTATHPELLPDVGEKHCYSIRQGRIIGP